MLRNVAAVLLLAGAIAHSTSAQVHRPGVSHSAATAITAALLSDPHLDPFRDPAKAKRLASAPASEWGAILAAPASATAAQDYAALQKTCSEKLDDADASLELSALDDARASKPAFVLVGGDMIVHAFGCRYKTLLDPAGTDKAGLADFAAKTVEFQMAELHRRFPATPVHLALGNNDSDCEDYSLDEDSTFLRRIAPAVASGWAGVSAAKRSAALQDFKRFGSYSLPLPSSDANTRVIVLDDLYLSSDYRGTCGKAVNRASSAALLTWFEQQLAAAKRAHEAVWVLAHIPPEVNIYRTYLHPHDICHGQPPENYFAAQSFNDLLTRYADTVRVFISGHTHVDEIHLIEANHIASGAGSSSLVPLKTIPSISPISTNSPAYLLAEVDRGTGTLRTYSMRTASSSGHGYQWQTAYSFQQTFHEPEFSAASVAEMMTRWQRSPESAAGEISAYQQHVASGLRRLALMASWPQQLCAMQHSSNAAFTQCACSAQGGLLPPAQSAK